jgi:hypothetical protein
MLHFPFTLLKHSTAHPACPTGVSQQMPPLLSLVAPVYPWAEELACRWVEERVCQSAAPASPLAAPRYQWAQEEPYRSALAPASRLALPQCQLALEEAYWLVLAQGCVLVMVATWLLAAPFGSRWAQASVWLSSSASA